MPTDQVVVKLDFANAFNSLDRSYMLQRVSEEIPELYQLCHTAYDQPSALQFGQFSISSEVGPQQGDPLGGVLFCLSIQPILAACNSSLVLGYMDDVTLGGPPDAVSQDVELFRSKGQDIGLILNSAKCEVICHQHPMSNEFNQFQMLPLDAATLLGAPINTGSALDEAITSRNAALKTAVDRLYTLPAHEALVLLKSSLSTPKVMHILRCSPCHRHPSLQEFDFQASSLQTFKFSFQAILCFFMLSARRINALRNARF